MNRPPYARSLVLFAVLFAAGCSRSQDVKPLIWGADASGGVPYVFADPNDPDKMIGFEVDLAAALAREMGRPIEFQQRKFDSLLNDVERGDIDFAMNGLEILPDRLNQVRFTKPYYLYQLQLVVKSGAPMETIAEIKEKNLPVGTLGGSAAQRVLEENGVDVRPFDDQDNPFLVLSRGNELGGVLLDLPIAVYYANSDKTLAHRRENKGLRYAGKPFAEGVYGIAVRRNNEELVNDLNVALIRLRDNGELKSILEKWKIWTPDQDRLPSLPDIEAAPSRIEFKTFLPLLLKASLLTIFLAVAGMALAVGLGLPIALARLYGSAPLRWAAIAYIELFRGIPLLMIFTFLYYALPMIFPLLTMGPLTAAILGIGLNYAAYEAEIYRTGFASIPPGQWEASASLGMSPELSFRRIVFPQAVRVILPPMTNDFVALFKDTAQVSTLALVELTYQYQILLKSGAGVLQVSLTTAALYLIISIPLGHVSRVLEERWGSK